MPRRRRGPAGVNGIPAGYWKACDLAREGRYDEARLAYGRLQRSAAKKNARLSALIHNDLAVIAATEGQQAEACGAWRAVLDMKESLGKAKIVHQDAALGQAAEQDFYNTSKFTLRD
jgi:hypothetical protein